MAGLLTDPADAPLSATIARWAAEPCAPYPCAADVLRHACEVVGAPVPELPAHGTRADMCRSLRTGGGLIGLAHTYLLPLGWQRLDQWRTPQARGDVGVVLFPGRMWASCAICLGSTWMARGNGFVEVLPAWPLAMWRAPCRKR